MGNVSVASERFETTPQSFRLGTRTNDPVGGILSQDLSFPKAADLSYMNPIVGFRYKDTGPDGYWGLNIIMSDGSRSSWEE